MGLGPGSDSGLGKRSNLELGLGSDPGLELGSELRLEKKFDSALGPESDSRLETGTGSTNRQPLYLSTLRKRGKFTIFESTPRGGGKSGH